MRILLDSNSNDPNYLQIENAIRSAICQGQLRPQEQLPSIRQLAKQLQGMIETRQGKGCFVCSLDVQTVQEQAGAQLIEEFQATLDKGLKLGLTLPQIQTLFDQAQKTVIQEKREKL